LSVQPVVAHKRLKALRCCGSTLFAMNTIIPDFRCHSAHISHSRIASINQNKSGNPSNEPTILLPGETVLLFSHVCLYIGNLGFGLIRFCLPKEHLCHVKRKIGMNRNFRRLAGDAWRYLHRRAAECSHFEYGRVPLRENWPHIIKRRNERNRLSMVRIYV
jgi:hypothetical protein